MMFIISSAPKQLMEKHFDLLTIKIGMYVLIAFALGLAIGSGGLIHKYVECDNPEGCVMSEYDAGLNNTLESNYRYITLADGEIIGNKPSWLIRNFEPLSFFAIVFIFIVAWNTRRTQKK
jgi:hypothetical protein